MLHEYRYLIFVLFAAMLASLAAVFAIVASFSRAGQAVTAAYVLAVLGVVLWRAYSWRALSIATVIVLVMLGGAAKAFDAVINRFVNAPAASEKAREEFNAAADLMARDHIFGVGPNNFSRALTVTRRYHKVIFVMGNERTAGVCHHIYRLVAAEMGYPALLVFLVVLGRFCWRALRRGWRGRSLKAMLLWGIVFGFTALHATGFLEWTLWQTAVLFLFMATAALSVYLGDVVAWQRQAPRTPRAPAPAPTGPVSTSLPVHVKFEE